MVIVRAAPHVHLEAGRLKPDGKLLGCKEAMFSGMKGLAFFDDISWLHAA